MNEAQKISCPECEPRTDGLDRRTFIAVGMMAVGGAAGFKTPGLFADEPAPAPARQAKPAEAMIQELYGTLTNDQKTNVVLPWNDPRRHGMFNAAFGRTITASYTPAQRELVERILRSISSGDDGYSKLTRNGTFDGSGSFGNCGAYIFGDPTNGQQYAWVFCGHHITVRCDGNSQPDAAFGGPMYYGHSPDGYSQRNCFFYQTRAVLSVFDALNERQRTQAIVIGSPGEQAESIRFRAAGQAHPGIAASELTADQRRLVETVMREVLSPYRREDADEVMQIVRRNGGMERIHLAFYRDRGGDEDTRWHFWRLEGPGFVWNYRVLPHVHTFVNIAAV